MPKKLEDMDIEIVAGVDKAANRRKWLIIKREDSIEKATKTEGGLEFPKSDYAYTPSDNVSEWKLRLTKEPGGTPDASIIGAAVAALGKGFRGNKVIIPEADLASVKAKVKAAWKKANPDKGDEDMPTILKGGEYVDKDDGPNLDDMHFEVEAVTEGISKYLEAVKKVGRKISGGRISMIGEIKAMMDKASMMMQSMMDEASGKQNTEKRSENMPITDEVRKGLDQEVQDYLSELEEKVAKVDELKEEMTKLKSDGEPEKDVLKGADPEIQKRFDDLNKKVEEAESIAKTEKEARVSKEFEDKAKEIPLIGSAEDVSKMLRAAYEVSEEDGKKLEETLKAANEKIKTNDLLTKEIGRSGAGSDAETQLETMAKEKAEKDSITYEKAYSEITKSGKGRELLEQIDNERQVS